MASEETPATQPTAPVKKPFYRRPKVWLISLASLLALPLALLVAVYFALNSSLLKKLVWPQVQPILAEQGFAAEIDDLRLSLFSRFYLKNLQVQQLAANQSTNAAASCGNFRLSLDEVEVNYALWPLIIKQHLEVSQLKVSDLTAEGCLFLDLNAETPEKEPEVAEELDLEASLNQLVSLLNNPPLSFNLKELSLNNINFDLEVKEVNQQLSASWQGNFELNGKATWQAEEITAQLTSNLNSYKPLTAEVDSGLNLSTQPEAAINLNLVIAKQGEIWQLEVEPTTSHFSLIDTQLTLEDTSPEPANSTPETLEVSLAKYQINLTPSYVDKQLEVQLNQVLTGLASEHSHQPLNFNQQLNLQVQPQAEKINLTATSQLNQLQLLQLEASLANKSPQLNESQQLNLSHQLTVNLPLELAEILTEPALAELPGNLSFNTQGTSQLEHSFSSLEELLAVLAEGSYLAEGSNSNLDQLTGRINHASSFNLELTQPTGDLQLNGPISGNFSLLTQLPNYNPKISFNLASQGVAFAPLALPEGLNLELTASLDENLTNLNSWLKIHFNQLEVKDQLEVEESPDEPQLLAKNLSLEATAKVNSLTEPNKASWQLTSQADELTVYEDGQALNALEALPLASHGKLAFNQQTQEAGLEELVIQEIVIQLGELFYQQLSGIAKLANPEEPSLQLSGVTQLTPNENSHLLKAFNVTVDGKLNFPWQLLVEEGKHLAFSGEPSFTNFNLSTPEVELTNLNANLKLNEELSLGENNKLRFRYLLTPEAFERVDFSQIEPFLNPTGNFSFNQLTLKEEGANTLSLGPLEAKLALEQNLVELPYFSLAALDGNLAGQFYFDLNPQGWRLGLLSRITQLDLRQLLANSTNTKTSSKNNSKHAPVSARTAVEFDFNQRLLTGRIDITDINRPQLLQLLELVDPEYTDPQINQVRTALRLAHPQWLSVQMQNGLMNIDFGLSLFSQPLRAHGLPLSPIIERFGEAALALPDELPLE